MKLYEGRMVMWLQQDMTKSPPKQKVVRGDVQFVRGDLVIVMSNDTPRGYVRRTDYVHKDYIMDYDYAEHKKLEELLK